MKSKIYQKDIDIIRALRAGACACPTPLFEASLPLYTAALKQGYGMEDTAAIHAVLRKRAGLKGARPRQIQQRRILRQAVHDKPNPSLLSLPTRSRPHPGLDHHRLPRQRQDARSSTGWSSARR